MPILVDELEAVFDDPFDLKRFWKQFSMTPLIRNPES